MSGYAFHPDAFADLDEIWEYIAQDNVDAADRVLADINSTLTTLAASPEIGHHRPDLTLRFRLRDQGCVTAVSQLRTGNDSNAATIADWKQARSVLGQGDHYLLVMIDRAVGRQLKPWWKFW